MSSSLHREFQQPLLVTSSPHRSKHIRQKACAGLQHGLLCLQTLQSDPEAGLYLSAFVPNMDSQPVGMDPVYVKIRYVKTSIA